MRSVYLPGEIQNDSTVILNNETAHHLIKVVRVKLGEEILGLNGKGQVYKFKVVDLAKKDLSLELLESEYIEKSQKIDLAIGQTKRDALDLIIKQACELGVSRVIILATKYSQRYEIKADRIQKLLISALEQSNNPYLPEVLVKDFKDLATNEYDQIVFYSSIADGEGKPIKAAQSPLIVIGPEGGFSKEEEAELRSLENSICFKLKTPILRAQTAVSTCFGHYLGMLE